MGSSISKHNEQVNVVSPQAYAIIFNYADRVSSIDKKTTASGAKRLSEVFINTTSLISLKTTKPKGTPSGSFEIVLAPTRNWLTMITPGSWVAISMTRDSEIGTITKKAKTIVSASADEDQLKMFGRIDTINVDVAVNPETGARSTTYVVRGRDWGSVFDTTLYVDPLYTQSFKALDGVTAQSLILGNNGKVFRGTTELIKSIITFWGEPLEALRTNNEKITSDAQFVLPAEAAKYMFGSTKKDTFSKLITVVAGRLIADDKYEDIVESAGYVDVNSLFGAHSFWQVLGDNCNNTINELVSEMRWVRGKPQLTLYKRVKPFGNRRALPTDAQGMQHLYSRFKHVKTTDIQLSDMISINAATDFNDKVNFIELIPKYHGLGKLNSLLIENKIDARIVDTKAYAREGFKPMFATPNFYSVKKDGSEANITESFIATTDWKYLLREWFFNTHTLLKGTFTFVGQSKYIGVGENIRVNSIVLGHSPMTSAADRSTPTYMTAHVEGISHSFIIDPSTGARRFTTTVSFVRGIITDKNSNPLQGSISALDSEAVGSGRFNTNTVSTSFDHDPDAQKKKGN